MYALVMANALVAGYISTRGHYGAMLAKGTPAVVKHVAERAYALAEGLLRERRKRMKQAK